MNDKLIAKRDASPSGERTAFESWMQENRPSHSLEFENGGYTHAPVGSLWKCWQAAVEFDRQGRGEAVAWAAFAGYLIDNFEGHEISEERMQRALAGMLEITPQPAEPVKEVSDADLFTIHDEYFPTMALGHENFLLFARALLTRYGAAQPALTEWERCADLEAEQGRSGMLDGQAQEPSDETQQKLVPIEPTETMIISGFESAPDRNFSPPEEWGRYEAMSGCQQAAYRAEKCWAAMLAATPTPPADVQAQQDVDKADALPPPELTWLYGHCKAIGMTCKSDSGKWEHDIALFTVNLTDELAKLRAQPDPETAWDESEISPDTLGRLCSGIATSGDQLVAWNELVRLSVHPTSGEDAALLTKLHDAANYIDILGGDSKAYRIAQQGGQS